MPDEGIIVKRLLTAGSILKHLARVHISVSLVPLTDLQVDVDDSQVSLVLACSMQTSRCNIYFLTSTGALVIAFVQLITIQRLLSWGDAQSILLGRI